jgi:hypothetical protein
MDRGRTDATFLSMKQAAAALGVHENTLRNWLSNGIIHSARAPGARFHRFAAAEVERVRVARFSGPESVQRGRRIVGPELVDATRLGIWAETLEARHIFPKLVRRLLAATPGATDLSARAGEGISSAGWDAEVTLTTETSWLPAGKIVFELGVGAASRSKAQRDYDKRLADPLGLDQADVTFVFATPRRWRGGADWANERTEDGVWKAVRVLDGDDLESWLEAIPAVHYWISEEVGLKPYGIQTGEQWWSQFCNRTKPALPPDLFLAGREGARTALLEQIAASNEPIAVQAAWREDAVAFTLTAIQGHFEDAAPERPALVVESEEVWRRVAAEAGATVLIPLFDEPDLHLATSHGKWVIVPLSATDVPNGRSVQVPPAGRRAAQEALQRAEIEFGEADRLAALARRSMPALIRRLAVNQRFNKPSWSQAPASDVLAPLVLAAAWTSTARDHDVLSELVGRPWDEIERVLRAAASGDDPPFVESGNIWRVASHEEIFEVLGPSLTSTDVQRWMRVAARVLLEADPLVDLEGEEKMLALIRGNEARTSDALRQGLASGLALTGSHGSRPLPGAMTCERCAHHVARALLDAATADASGTTWRSLSAELPLIAEAAPSLFLDRISDDSRGVSPLLAGMFIDQDASPLGISSPHTGLLWALETLCWSDDYLVDATRCLAQLKTVDPGGRLSNRPGASLGNVLVPWIRHTSATLDTRLAAIDCVVSDVADVGWELLMTLWPSLHGVAMPPHRPTYRDWTPQDRAVPITEWFAFVDHLLSLAVEEAGDDVSRWSELATKLAPLAPTHRDRLITMLGELGERIAHDDLARLVLWEAVVNEVARHRAFPLAKWVMPNDALDRLAALAERLEPTGSTERHARLFDWNPDIADSPVDDFGAYEETLHRLREKAIREALNTGQLDAVAKLAERAPTPHFVGQVLAQVSGDDHRDTLLSWLKAAGAKQTVALAWMRYQSYTKDFGWTARAIADVDDDAARLQVALQAPPIPELWELLDTLRNEIADRYWTQTSPFGIASEHIAAAASELLRRDRPWAAVTCLATELHRPADGRAALDRNQVLEVLDAARKGPGMPEKRGDSLGYEIGVLMDFLEADQVDLALLARLEFAFFPLLEHQRPARALYTALENEPELFVELVSRLYRGKNEPRQSPNPATAAFATNAWHVLRNWRIVPGSGDDGRIDPGRLEAWVQRTRFLLTECDRSDVGDEQIGQLLSGSPSGTDGAWPAEPIRDLVEKLGNREIENGIQIGRLNGHSGTTRGVYDGGAIERGFAATCRDWSNTTSKKWPRTSRLLRELAESYERDAAREDARARELADAG